MSSRHGFIRGVLAAFVAAVGFAAFVAAPANAQLGACASGATCLYKDANYQSYGSNYHVPYQQYIPLFSQYDYFYGAGGSDSAYHTVTSVYNNGNSQSTGLFVDEWGNGLGFVLAKKKGVPQLGSAWNDQLESGYFCGYTTFC